MIKKMIKLVLVGVLALGITATVNISAEAATHKVMWGKTELKAGQIGKVTILADTDLVKIGSNGSLSKVRTLKKGDEYRVYTYKGTNGGLYGLGASSFVQKSTKLKYETPSKSKLALLNKEVHGGITPKAGMKLTYSPSFTEPTKREFITKVENEFGANRTLLTIPGQEIGGYVYNEFTSDEGDSTITFGVNYTDWGLFNVQYPLIEGKQTKEIDYDGNDRIIYNINVISTTSTVTVKAGTFQNVVIFKTNAGYTYYLAPGVGIIKMIGSDGILDAELISFK
ncbi:hypothetical protein [Psychrobacillus sp. MER TA 171]|uniref:hypothetical protein n=1 Tax=Psychrobacillus sp. MER TA 171 TaxID=2939577 RepID=UPI00203D7764|nr:hypothetical protein [Psychrobacillus sp. MER TA 171]MCM3359206.1 hypothetical protein [Psychrobacillus sp. MER TA 171]